MESVTQFITQRLKLTVNEAKSAVARPQERKFLGFSFYGLVRRSKRRVIAPKALDRFKQRVREITRPGLRGVSMEATMDELAPYMRGWRSYFGFCENAESVDSTSTRWVRLRLRAAMWAAVEKHRAVAERLCWNWGSVHGLAKQYPAGSGLGPLVPSREPKPSLWGFLMLTFKIARTSNHCSRRVRRKPTRTAVYGPVRTVVWQGSAGEPAAPYADQWRLCRVRAAGIAAPSRCSKLLGTSAKWPGLWLGHG